MTRPKTTVILAMSADGKISDVDRTPPHFGSKADYRHLEEQVALADAVLFGAGTLRSGGTAMRVQRPELIAQRSVQGKPEQPIQAVCSRSGKIPSDIKFFNQPITRWLVTTHSGAESWQTSDQFHQVVIASAPEETHLSWPIFFKQCLDAGIETLAVLGGGAVVANLLEQGFIDELHLTICPILLGGEQAPSPVDGNGLTQDLAPRLSLLSCKQMEGELFLHYKVLRDQD